MVQAFISDVFGWESEDRGVFGHTNAFYAIVEQQGRLSLHAHAVIWITNSLSPQEIWDRIMKPSSKFRKRLIAYVEDCHRAEFFNGTRDAVILKRKVEPPPPDADSYDKLEDGSLYRPPTQTFGTAPPKLCVSSACLPTCARFKASAEWRDRYKLEVDDLLVRSNIHDHYLSGCLTKSGVCRVRFPRDVYRVSKISPDGHVNVRHLESMMNTTNPILTYLCRCNSDVTCLLSGTAVKAVVSYVSDYISKLSLKSYQMFTSVYDVMCSRRIRR
ncbi:hypothetical protein FB451DRAFT_1046335 [Mycena latifolia]|nr:hypothetical protein FB451DRAFT_1046335 [Mycena latifolia]